MKTYVVTFTNTITRTYTIEAESKEEAIETAQAQVDDFDDETREEKFDAVRNYRWETDLDESDKDIRCPYCGSANIKATDDGRYHCLDDDYLFDEEDIERENLRHQISPLLNETSEEEPMLLSVPEIGEEEAQGLSSLELPEIDKAFEMEGDGTIWFHFKDTPEGDWTNFDDLSTSDLRKILTALR